MDTNPYIGRFAPSPTGPLHFGSLLAAVGSYLDARSHQGQWLIRIEDIDYLREVPDAANQILRQLEHYGFMWDGVVSYQRQRLAYYQQALEQLLQQKLAYPCCCSRRDIAAASANRIYLGTCRQGMRRAEANPAIRVRTDDSAICLEDQVQGHFCQYLTSDIGDFIIRRKDGIHAYQLAVVIDDAEQRISHVVRGSDLLDSTPRQMYLQRLLSLPTPHYAHLPILVDQRGDKLSKQAGAPSIAMDNPVALLCKALKLLGQAIPDALHQASLDEFWQWAIANWQMAQVPKTYSLTIQQTI